MCEFKEITISNHIFSAKINLFQGGRLQILKAGKMTIIGEPFPYENSYAGALMFPFCGRITNGLYSFDGKNYQLDINDKANNASLHGLIYNKIFQLKSKTESSVNLTHTSDRQESFPFKYEIELLYELHENSFSLRAKVTNKDEKSFPFALGWHPYFYSKDLYKSELYFESSRRAVFDSSMVLKSFEEIKTATPFSIETKTFDDCFELTSPEIRFKTPDYQLKINNANFVQLYTPENRNYIAIEPLSAPSNSLNNHIGLKILEPNKSFASQWKVEITL